MDEIWVLNFRPNWNLSSISENIIFPRYKLMIMAYDNNGIIAASRMPQ